MQAQHGQTPPALGTKKRFCAGALAAALLGLTSCGSPPAPAAPEASTEPSQDVSDVSTAAQPSEVASAPSTATATTNPEAESTPAAVPAPRSGQELCEELCAKVEESCRPDSAKFCRANCADYQATSERCPFEVEEALTCQMNSESFLLCSSVASEQCAPAYHAMDQCRDGNAEPMTQPRSQSEGPPAGWHRVELDAFGGSFLFPDGPMKTQKTAREVTRDGFAFRVEELPKPTAQYTDRSILRLASEYVGEACRKPLRLHGRYETADVIHVRFTTSCKSADGELLWDGILHLSPGRAVAASVKPATESGTPKGTSGSTEPGELPSDADTFFFGFEPAH